MTRKKSGSREVDLRSAEEIQNELAQVESIDDFFGKEGVFGTPFDTPYRKASSDRRTLCYSAP